MLPIPSSFKRKGSASKVALTASGLSSAYSQMPEIIPSPKSEDNSLKRSGDGFAPCEVEVVSKVKQIDASIALFRSCGVSGLCR